jgi:hypothetical protein
VCFKSAWCGFYRYRGDPDQEDPCEDGHCDEGVGVAEAVEENAAKNGAGDGTKPGC